MGEMGKAMMGTGEASGDNRAIEAAEKAIANPLLDGVSMQGAKGVIVSITGGEDMRLMEVDEAANHIRELVDPDANIIWGSAFNNDLEGKIRVSVVATGIEAQEGPVAEPAKVFSFPAAKPKVEPIAAAPVAVQAPAPVETAAEPVTPVAATATVAAATSVEPETAEAPADEGDELLLGSDTILTPPVAGNPLPTAETAPRRWRSETEDEAVAPARATKAPPTQSGTLFERMSSIARGAAKAQVEEEPVIERGKTPLDLPGFLKSQNNQ
jgi:cell division protein FtsZ